MINRILVKDPAQRIDMEGLRMHKWTNIGYNAPPERVIPKFTKEIDISQRVSGISYDKKFTIINLNKPNPSGNPSSSTEANFPTIHIPELNVRFRQKSLSPSLGSSPLQYEHRPDASPIDINYPVSSPSTTTPHGQNIDVKILEEWHKLHRPPKTIRQMQIPLRKGITSVRDPSTMFQDLHRALTELQGKSEGILKFERTSDYYLFDCTITRPIEDPATEEKVIKFELEICKVWGWGNLHGLQGKRISGGALSYNTFFQQIITALAW